MGLVAICTDSKYPDIDGDAVPQLPIQSNVLAGTSCIKVNHLQHGYMHAIIQIMMESGMQVMTTLIKRIRTYILDSWKLRNTHLHKNAHQIDLPNYHQAVTTLYELHAQLPPEAQTALYQQQPTLQLQQWFT